MHTIKDGCIEYEVAGFNVSFEGDHSTIRKNVIHLLFVDGTIKWFIAKSREKPYGLQTNSLNVVFPIATFYGIQSLLKKRHINLKCQNKRFKYHHIKWSTSYYQKIFELSLTIA